MPKLIIKKIKPLHIAYAMWAVAIAGSLGSLALSSIWEFIPCTLCWYQRGFMFALPFVIGAGVWLKDKNIFYYVLPLTIAGGVIALYQSLIQWQMVPYDASQCVVGVPCDTRYIDWFGFITIPFMALITFCAIGFLAYMHYRLGNKK